jgi:protein AroM
VAVKPKLGLLTIGQAPRVDVVPDMADVLGPEVEIVERGALDGLSRETIAALAPAPGDDVLVTRLADGSPVFVGKSAIAPHLRTQLADLEAVGVDIAVLLCTGTFHGLVARRPVIEPDRVLVGVVRGVRFAGRLGVVTPSERHVAATGARWRAYGFDSVVVPSSPYETPASLDAIAGGLEAGGVGLVVLDCIGFRRPLRAALQQRLGVPVVVANLLVARVVAEMLGV